MYSRIIGTGSYLPERVLTNAELEGMIDTTDEWIRSRTGIERRHLLQARLGIAGPPAIQVEAACSGFIYASSVADKFIRLARHACITRH